jgi:hypothetical protein
MEGFFMGAWTPRAAVFTLVFLAHAMSPVMTSGDSRWTVPLALSLWDRGDLDLNEYPEDLRRRSYAGAECVEATGRIVPAAPCPNGRLRYAYPMGTPVLVTPLVALERAGAGLLARAVTLRTGRPALDAFLAGDVLAAYGVIEVITASFLVACTATVLFILSRRFVTAGKAATIALLFAFATPAWSTASRALWQHGPSMLATAVTVYLLWIAREKPWAAACAGLPVAMSYTIRPTNGLFVVIATLYVARHHRRQLAAFLLCGAPVAVAFFAFNLTAYGSLLSGYYLLRPPLPTSPAAMLQVLKVMAAHLISPSRGLLVFVPLVFFSAWGMWRAWRTGWAAPLSRWLAVYLIANWVALSLYVEYWFGGYSYGPRFFTDTMPVFAFFLIPVLKDFEWRTGARRPVFAAFVAAAIFSVWVHGKGAWKFSVQQWNESPRPVDSARAWDWSDPQFLR